MDITDSSTERIEVGVQLLLEGNSLALDGIVFCWNDPDHYELLVLSYSDNAYLENVRHDEAQEKINRSKVVAQNLAQTSLSFGTMWQKTRRRFQFCFDNQTGSVVLAEEEHGQIIWKKR